MQFNREAIHHKWLWLERVAWEGGVGEEEEDCSLAVGRGRASSRVG